MEADHKEKTITSLEGCNFWLAPEPLGWRGRMQVDFSDVVNSLVNQSWLHNANPLKTLDNTAHGTCWLVAGHMNLLRG
jgi:hypothetical protein